MNIGKLRRHFVDVHSRRRLNRAQARLEEKTLAFLDRMMGRLTIRFSNSEMALDMPDWTTVFRWNGDANEGI